MLKPFIKYFVKCNYPKDNSGKMFHIIGYDIILDHNCKPYLLELNANPSLNVEFELDDYKFNPVNITQKAKEEGRPGKDPKAKPGNENMTSAFKSTAREPDPASKARHRGTSLAKTVIETRKVETKDKSIERKAGNTKSNNIGWREPKIPEEVAEEDEDTNYLKAGRQKLMDKYIKFQNSRTDITRRGKPIQTNPICIVDLHVKSL